MSTAEKLGGLPRVISRFVRFTPTAAGSAAPRGREQHEVLPVERERVIEQFAERERTQDDGQLSLRGETFWSMLWPGVNGDLNRRTGAAGIGRRAGRALPATSWLLTTACGSSPITPTPPPVPLPPALGLSCGTERWSVKTLSDADASTLNLSNVLPVSIKALNQMPAHCGGAPDARTYPQEFQVTTSPARSSS